MSMIRLTTRLAQHWLDRHARAPRGFFSVDEGMPDRGRRYGGAQTIHNTGTIDVVMNNGKVTEVWFRCQQLAFRVSERGEGYGIVDAYTGDGAAVVAVEVTP